jgi:hypothetical protein
MFANSHDIYSWQQRYNNATGYPLAGNLADNVAALADWADSNSDGWSTWPKPSRAAARATQALFDLQARERRAWRDREPDLKPHEVRSALVPVRAFLTRQGVDPDSVLLPLPTA